METLKKLYLYRMTHIKNIPHILQNGITHIAAPNRNPEYESIGDGNLIANREKKTLFNGFKLGDYIPFYFGYRMPMLFVIHNGFNGVKKTSSENIVYCITSVQQIIDHNLDFIFSDGHAVDDFTDIFDKEEVSDILIIIDKKAIESKYWKDETDLDLKRRKEAEFLIAQDIPISAVLGYAVYDETAKQKLIDFGINENKIAIKPNYYF